MLNKLLSILKPKKEENTLTPNRRMMGDESMDEVSPPTVDMDRFRRSLPTPILGKDGKYRLRPIHPVDPGFYLKPSPTPPNEKPIINPITEPVLPPSKLPDPGKRGIHPPRPIKDPGRIVGGPVRRPPNPGKLFDYLKGLTEEERYKIYDDAHNNQRNIPLEDNAKVNKIEPTNTPIFSRLKNLFNKKKNT
jgi:hypothetical protein